MGVLVDGADAELALVVSSPSPDPAVLIQRQGVFVSGTNGDDIMNVQNRKPIKCRVDILITNAELAIIVSSQGFDITISSYPKKMMFLNGYRNFMSAIDSGTISYYVSKEFLIEVSRVAGAARKG